MITQLDSETADRDLTSTITVLTDTPDASNAMQCQAYVAVGDGSKDLDGTGGAFELTITVGGQTVQPASDVIFFGTEVRAGIYSSVFPVPANQEVIVRIKSPNGADTDVGVTGYLFSISTEEVDLVKCGGNAVAAGAIPNAAADAAGGLPVSDAGGLDLDALNTAIISGGVALADGYLTAAKFATACITAAKLATDAIGATELSAAAANKIADHKIRRTFQNACDSADGDAKAFRSELGAMAKLVNKLSLSGTTLTITEDDDVTTLGTQTVTKDAQAEPITAVDTD